MIQALRLLGMANSHTRTAPTTPTIAAQQRSIIQQTFIHTNINANATDYLSDEGNVQFGPQLPEQRMPNDIGRRPTDRSSSENTTQYDRIEFNVKRARDSIPGTREQPSRERRIVVSFKL